MMDVFTEFEEGQRPWNSQKFTQKCNEVYQKISAGDKAELMKIYNNKATTKQS